MSQKMGETRGGRERDRERERKKNGKGKEKKKKGVKGEKKS